MKSHVLNNVLYDSKTPSSESQKMEINGDCDGQGNMDTSLSVQEDTAPTENAVVPNENTDIITNENAINVISDET